MAYVLNNKKKQSLFAQLQMLLNAGLDFSRAFSLVVSGAEGKDRDVLASVFDNVVSGQPLWMSMQISGSFPAIDYGVIRIGEETGRLSYSFKFLVDYYARKENQKRILVNALSYPMITLCIAVAVMAFMLAVVVPMFQNVYDRLGGELPSMTLFIISISKALPFIWFVLLSCCVAAVFVRNFFGKTYWYRSMVSYILLSMPYGGSLIRKYYQTRFCRLGYLLISSGVPVLNALTMIRDVIGLWSYEQSISEICSCIERGGSFSEGMEHYENLYGRNLVTLLKVGEETNRLDNMLESQADSIGMELDYEIRQLNNVVEPMMILVIGAVVAFILIAMYLPMFRLGMTIM